MTHEGSDQDDPAEPERTADGPAGRGHWWAEDRPQPTPARSFGPPTPGDNLYGPSAPPPPPSPEPELATTLAGGLLALAAFIAGLLVSALSAFYILSSAAHGRGSWWIFLPTVAGGALCSAAAGRLPKISMIRHLLLVFGWTTVAATSLLGGLGWYFGSWGYQDSPH